MGQAKQRGSFEERQQQAVQAREERYAASEAERLAAQKAEDDRIDRMTPAEQEAYFSRRPRRSKVGTMLAVTALIGGSYW